MVRSSVGQSSPVVGSRKPERARVASLSAEVRVSTPWLNVVSKTPQRTRIRSRNGGTDGRLRTLAFPPAQLLVSMRSMWTQGMAVRNPLPNWNCCTAGCRRQLRPSRVVEVGISCSGTKRASATRSASAWARRARRRWVHPGLTVQPCQRETYQWESSSRPDEVEPAEWPAWLWRYYSAR